MKKIMLLLFTSIVLFGAPPKFLMPDEAFIPHVKLNDSMQIEATVEIAKDIYLYEDSMKLEIINSDGVTIGKVDSPKSVEHHEEMVYLTSPSFVVNLVKDDSAKGIKKVEFQISYQGCSEQGLCYEPLSKSYTFEVDSSKLTTAEKKEIKTLETEPLNQGSKETEVKDKELSKSDAIADTINSGSLPLIILSFLGFGLLLALTPCTFPMIPIISGLIISHGENITTKKAFFLSLVYVLSMSVAYTIAGVLAGLFGANLQAALQTPWVIYSFSAVFIALAMSMFGYFELKLPDSFVSKVSSTRKQSGVFGVALMGFLSALIVGPCVAAPLSGALIYIGQTGDAVLGGMALFALSIGMGLPLILVGVSAGKFMPKPGAWMTMVSAIFGVMMLGVAIWMLERVVDTYVTMLLWSILGIGFAIYLGALQKEGSVLKKSISTVIFIYSVALFIGTLGGSNSMSKPLEFLKPQVVSASEAKSLHVEFTKITSIKELDELIAKNSGKKIMLDFYADWCTSCKELEKVTFANENVKSKMSEFVLIKADVTANGEDEKSLSKKYGVFGPPAILFFDESGKVIKSKTIIGFAEPSEFLTHLNKI